MNHPMERWYNAVGQRFSVRKYTDTPNDSDMEKLNECAEMLSSNGVRIVLGESKEVFSSMFLGYGKITGTTAFAALIAKPGNERFVGYIGEAFVLECTALGLGTCWIGGTYKKNAVNKMIETSKDEIIVCIISIGAFSVPHVGSSRKTLDVLTGLNNDVLVQLPEWQKCALECARLAPSAVNKQPWEFIIEGNSISVKNTSHNFGFGKLDCGIAMLHVELGASHAGVTGEWEHFADYARFIPYESE